ncbi:MAG: class I tRNA ligase family protein, partial [Clostridia bacterium]|nr:class I tRNA ligase family protein [Clostridia bacterium]
VDPLKVIEEYGADTLRFSLLTGVAAGSDIRFSTEKCESSRNFINKIWNASRFVIMNLEGVETLPIDKVKLELKDKWILSKLNKTVKEVTKAMEKFDLGVALSTAHDFMWYDFCDWYIELSKTALYGENEAKKINTLSVLKYVLVETLKLLHPYIPFVTEEIYKNLVGEGSIMVSDYPKYNPRKTYKKDLEKMNSVMDIIKAVRQIKAQVGAASSKKVDLIIVTENQKLVRDNSQFIEKLAGVMKIDFVGAKSEISEKVFTQVISGFEVYVPLGELVDIEKEIIKLKDDLLKAEEELARANAKLSNKGFVEKAPKDLVEKEKQKIEKYEQLIEKIKGNLKEYEA